MEELLKHLNDKQREAVETTEGPVLVLAGAGSGKTRVLTYRIAKIINDGTRPSSILAVTFTNKAANEIKARLEKICGDIHTLWAGTFHSICVRMLRERGEAIGISKKFTIYDEYAQNQCVKKAVENLKYDPKKYPPKKVLYLISDAKEKMVLPNDYAKKYSEKDAPQIGRIYAEYVNICRQNQALDFDDLIYYGVLLLKNSQEAREHYQRKFKYVHVDEFQDINLSQYELISLLAHPQDNIFCVGDDDQSIYGWRGADISIILNFKKDFKNCKIFKLEENYRSTKNILGAAYEIVKKNTKRNDKTIWTGNDQGDTIELIEAADNTQEARLVAETISRFVTSGDYTYSDIAILYRTNALSRNFEKEFTSMRIPYDVYGGQKFFERREIKDLVAYLNVLYNVYDDFSLKRIVNVPKRNIGETTVGKLEYFAMEQNISLFEAFERVTEISSVRNATKTNILSFVSLIKRIRKEAEIFTVDQIIESVLDYSGYKQMLYEEKTLEAEDRLNNLQEFMNVAVNFMRDSEDKSLGAFLESVSLQSDIDNMKDDAGKVLLMTVHASKGLEFPVVFVVGLEEGTFPHQRSMGNAIEIEEERRLMYVAMTRAKKNLILSCANTRQNNGNWERKHKSAFLKDIPKIYFKDTEGEVDTGESFEDVKKKVLRRKSVLQSYSPGNKVNHPFYGRGIVLNCKGEGEQEIVTVVFDDKKHGLKKFYASKTQLELL